jgi:hypothetical protein
MKKTQKKKKILKRVLKRAQWRNLQCRHHRVQIPKLQVPKLVHSRDLFFAACARVPASWYSSGQPQNRDGDQTLAQIFQYG